jgi:hypothetical protein
MRIGLRKAEADLRSAGAEPPAASDNIVYTLLIFRPSEAYIVRYSFDKGNFTAEMPSLSKKRTQYLLPCCHGDPYMINLGY